MWARNGRELFYRAPDGAVLGVDVTVDGARVRTGPPVTRVKSGYFLGGAFIGRTYDVSPDGRFVMIKEDDGSRDTAAPAPTIVVVQNWIEELTRLVPRN